jgi:large subunit ribosomal protein L21e
MRIGGARRKTRQKYKKNYKESGKISQRRYLQVLVAGDKVSLSSEPAVQKGMYHRRFHGKVGTVSKRLGRCYEVVIYDHDKEKRLIVHPVHLRKVA